MKTGQSKLPESYAKALAQGFKICDETSTGGELRRRGQFKMERRLDKSTGDREVIYVPFTAKFSVGRPHGHEVERHAYATSEETKRLEEAIRAGRKIAPASTPVTALAPSQDDPPSEIPRMTLLDAFQLEGGGGLDDEKAIRAAGLLLEWASESGNEPVDGWIAYGLSRMLDKAADKISSEMAIRWSERQEESDLQHQRFLDSRRELRAKQAEEAVLS
jgi:hypothetical protein